MIVIIYVYVKDFFVSTIFFNFSLLIPRPSSGAAASLKRATVSMRFASNFALL